MKAIILFLTMFGLSSVAHAWPKEATSRCPGGKRNSADLRYVQSFNNGLVKVYGYYYGEFHYMLENGKWSCIMFAPDLAANSCGRWTGKKHGCQWDPNPQESKFYQYSDRTVEWQNGFGPQSGTPAYDSRDGHIVGSW